MHAKSLQLCLTLHDPMDCSLPGSSVHRVTKSETRLTLCNSMDSSVHGILQARILEWVAMPSSRDL